MVGKSLIQENRATEKSYMKENTQLVSLVCKGYEDLSEINLNIQKQIRNQSEAKRQCRNIQRANQQEIDNIEFLKKKADDLETMGEHEKSRQKREQMLQTEICEIQILFKKKRLLELEKQIKEEEVRLVEQEKELGTLADILKSKLWQQIGQTINDFHKTDGAHS